MPQSSATFSPATLSPATLPSPTLLTTIQHAFAAQRIDEAARMLVDALPQLREPAERAAVAALLARMPSHLLEANPDLLYVQALLDAHSQPERAATLLRRAIIRYGEQSDLKRCAACYFELIRLALQQENFRTAQLYVGEAEQCVQQVADPAVQAHLYLRLAELCPDLGRLHEGIGYAKHALHTFRHGGEIAKQFKSHILLSILHRQAGHYDEAEAHLALAQQLQQAARLGAEAQTRILNAAAHLAWYRGDLVTALQQAERLVAATNPAEFPKAQVYGALLLANLYRAQGDFCAAHQWYSQSRMLVAQVGIPLFLPWVDVQEGWLHLLTGDYGMARKRIHQALTTPDRGQMMSFNVHLALLNLLEGQITPAEELLRRARPFYQQSGDALATAVIDLYLAHALQLGGHEAAAHHHLQAGLDWLAARHITYFPYWWHGGLVAQICAVALQWGVQVALVEHMIAHHIGNAARPSLTALLDDADPAVVQRVQSVLALLGEAQADWLAWLADVPDAPVQRVLEELLREKKLCPEALPALQCLFTTAQQRNKPNPVLLAVFGLYVQGATVKEIAARLQRAPSSVRNYITILYQVFELPLDNASSLQARRKQLHTLAQQRAYIR